MPAVDGNTLVRRDDTPVKNSTGDTWMGDQTFLNSKPLAGSGSVIRVPLHEALSIPGGPNLNSGYIRHSYPLPLPSTAEAAGGVLTVVPLYAQNMWSVVPFFCVPFTYGAESTTRLPNGKAALIIQFVFATTGTFSFFACEGYVLVTVP